MMQSKYLWVGGGYRIFFFIKYWLLIIKIFYTKIVINKVINIIVNIVINKIVEFGGEPNSGFEGQLTNRLYSSIACGLYFYFWQ